MDQIFDVAHFRRYTAGNAAFEAEIVDLFLSEMSTSLMALPASVESEDWGGSLHRLRGAALGIGAQRLAGAARCAEALPAGKPGERLIAISQIENEVAALIDELASHGLGAAK